MKEMQFDIKKTCEIALQKGKAEKIIDEELGEYLRFRDEFRKLMRGTVIVGNRAIMGYTHIERIFHLENGIKRNLQSSEIFIEEKIDGFNVRVAKINGRIYGFSRGGFCEKFLVEKVREFESLKKFFNENPELIICGEMIGETPHTKIEERYVNRNSKEEIQFFVFDILNSSGEFLEVKERYSLLEKYKINKTPFLGKVRTTDIKKISQIVLEINAENKEGIVMKTPDGKKAVKFVTANSDLGDILDGSRKFFDMPIGFFYQRILRIALFAEQFGMAEEFNERLGKSFLIGLKEAIESAKSGKDISEEFSILVRDTKIWDDIKKHMDKDVKLVEKGRSSRNGRTKINYEKIYKKTDKTLKAYLSGRAISD